uniref:Target of rapamycin complex 2 subunit MAPKAP1-like Ras-binding domain-containing protein n=1 Tax=Romanomermis culicivorax TaxID=13658 RepID=A0A915J335_ROMCU
MALEKFKSDQRILGVTSMDIQYQLEKLDECGIWLSLDKPISWARTKNFFLIRQNSVRPDASKIDFLTISSESALDSILSFIILQSYQLFMIRKSSEVSVMFELQQDLIEIRGAVKKKVWRNLRQSLVGGQVSFILRIPYMQVTNVKVEDEKDQAILYVSFLKSAKSPRQKIRRFRGRSLDLNELARNLKNNIKLNATSDYKKAYRNVSMTSSADAVPTKMANFSSMKISSIVASGVDDVNSSIHSKKSLFQKFQSVMTSFRSNR